MSKPRGTMHSAVGVAGLVISFAAGWYYVPRHLPRQSNRATLGLDLDLPAGIPRRLE
jgi:hypothetical protein